MTVRPETRRTRAGEPARVVRAASLAVFVIFVLNGVNFASWAARLPAVRDALRLDPAGMGLLMLGAGIGSIVALPLSGLVVMRLGAARTVLGFAAVNVLGFLLAAGGVAAGSVPLTAAGLVAVGIGTGVWDASMNLEGAMVEQRLGRTVMPRYHAGFSLGTVGAAGLAALAAGARVPVEVHIPVVTVVSLVCVAGAVRFFLPAGADAASPAAAEADLTSTSRTAGPAGPAGAADPAGPAGPAAGSVAARGADPHDPPAGPGMPSSRRGSSLGRALGAWLEPRTVLIGLVVLAAGLTEGSANDWLALAVVDGFHVGPEVGALSFALFVAAMTAMRLLGTRLLDRFGRLPVLRVSAVLSLTGLLVFCLVPADLLGVALAGAVVWGLGAALGFPVGMSAASDDPLHAAARVSVVSTIGYVAFLAGPPLLGMLAHAVGYRHALLAVAVAVAAGLLALPAAAPLQRPAAAPVQRPAAGTGPDVA